MDHQKLYLRETSLGYHLFMPSKGHTKKMRQLDHNRIVKLSPLEKPIIYHTSDLTREQAEQWAVSHLDELEKEIEDHAKYLRIKSATVDIASAGVLAISLATYVICAPVIAVGYLAHRIHKRITDPRWNKTRLKEHREKVQSIRSSVKNAVWNLEDIVQSESF